MKISARRGFAAGFALAASTAALCACSGGSDSSGTTASAVPAASAAAAAQPVGAGCADYAKAVPSGAGSVAGMSQAPVATAASNNPLLKTLVAAVSGKVNPKVDLTKTLNSGEFTVFAPVDSAFAKIPAAKLKAFSTDSDALTKVLTYHVVAGQLSPSDVVGTQTTMEGGTVKVSGDGANLKVNGVPVICGGVHTANATVYLIGGVLTPPK